MSEQEKNAQTPENRQGEEKAPRASLKRTEGEAAAAEAENAAPKNGAQAGPEAAGKGPVDAMAPGGANAAVTGQAPAAAGGSVATPVGPWPANSGPGGGPPAYGMPQWGGYGYPGQWQPAMAGAVAPGGFSGVAPARAVPVKKERQPFTATRADGLFALFCTVLGLLFIRWVLVNWAGWGMTAFTLLFAGGALCYMWGKKIRPAKASWFWLGALLGCGACFALWPQNLMQGYASLFLCGAAVYWCASAFGMLMQGKTGNLLGLDFINLVFIAPFANIDAPVLGLGGLRRGQKKPGGIWRRIWPVLVGMALCVPLLAIVLPMLVSADTTHFGPLLTDTLRFIFDPVFWNEIGQESAILFGQLMLGIPVAWYLYGYISGGAHRRYAKNISAAGARKAIDSWHVAPQATLMVVLWVVSAVYVVFIVCQIPNYFSAFRGIKPAEYAAFSEYARDGFFELCRIAAINLGLLALANSLCKRPTAKNLPLRIANLVLCTLTLLVIVTAFSKMGLYIAMHGYTPKRILTSVFMIFLALVCLAVMVRQFKTFSVVRLAAVCGSVLFCALCLCNLDGFVARQNVDRYLSGRLSTFDMLTLLRSGPAGVEAGYELYNELRFSRGADEDQLKQLAYVLDNESQKAWNTLGTSRDNAVNARVRQLNIAFGGKYLQEGHALFMQEYFPGRDYSREAPPPDGG